ncbi:hypothetical protein DFH05DRAFT_1385646 [Lentinula detonsa]|uniref:SWIM-type domain-containing protein n=1 Tax=Lentinula detonsa TaxID=2804962 RepID=A0A9W8PCJ7_9AGAR|nr:hypothetical protein DFH05DRAFT_1385646 [Lentinula detonsa]
MYMFCWQQGLREVWGYMWACWYCPQMWKLWARSSSDHILSRLRTTMGAENHFKLLKHEHLHHLVHPRLDQLSYKLIYEVTPAYFARTSLLDDDSRLGHGRRLSTYQKAFKTSFRRLSHRSLGTKHKYITNVQTWTCNCGQQKYSAFCLCKHLVQAVKEPDPRFFTEISRRRTIPIYWHPLLIAKDSAPTSASEDDLGSVTDGDDHIWSGSVAALKDGGWRELNGKTRTLLGKRRTEDNLDEEQVSSVGPIEDDYDAAEQEAMLDEQVEWALQRAQELQQAAEIIQKQVQDWNPIWLKSLKDRNVGQDVSNLVTDVRRHKGSARVRDTTWPRAGDYTGTRRMRNTMGYQKDIENVTPRSINDNPESSRANEHTNRCVIS